MTDVTPIREVQIQRIDVSFRIQIHQEEQVLHILEDGLSEQRLAAYLVIIKEEWKDEWGKCPIESVTEFTEVPGKDEPT